MKQVTILVSLLVMGCFLARLDSEGQDISPGEPDSVAPFFLDYSSTRETDSDSSTHATDPDLSTLAMSPLGLAAFEMEGERYEAATSHLRRGDSDGDLRCSYALGMLTLEGRGTERDPALAVDFLRKAAREGLPPAQATLGLLYASGVGVEKDEAMAAHWYREAARGGDAMGQAARGAVVFLGVGTRKDKVKGYMWTVLAAEQEHEGAYWNLAAMEARMTSAERVQAHFLADSFKPRSMPDAGRFHEETVIDIFQRDMKERFRICRGRPKCF
jgi:hypothetical protein